MLSDVDTTLSVAEHVLTCAAIVIGGIWTYRRFIRRREEQWRAELCAVSVRAVALGHGQRYVKAIANLKNTGDVPLYPWWAQSTLQQITPIEEVPQGVDGEIPWPVKARRELSYRGQDWLLEPGETGEVAFDLLIPLDACHVQLHILVYCAAEAPPANEPQLAIPGAGPADND